MNANANTNIGAAKPVDIEAPGVAKILAKQILDDIDLWAQKTFDDGHRNHLGCSLIGRECKRFLWYSFRWMVREKFDGRMLRLFQRGHREEDRYTEYLRGIGAQLWTHDENAPRKPDGSLPQFRVTWAGGHAGGSLDGIVVLPERYGYSKPMLAEFKTNATGRGFNDLRSGGMSLQKPDHWAQTCSYGYAYGFDHVLYMNTNKNDDDMHVEIVKLSANIGQQMQAKAELIVGSQTAPQRLSDSPVHQTCQYCSAKAVCHANGPIERNCRSCKNARPIPGPDWICEANNGLVIPLEVIKTGCPNWTDIRNA